MSFYFLLTSVNSTIDRSLKRTQNYLCHCIFPGGGGTPYNGLYGKNPSERGTFFRFGKDADFTIGKSAIWQSKEQKSKQKDLMGVKKARKSPDFVIYLTINE